MKLLGGGGFEKEDLQEKIKTIQVEITHNCVLIKHCGKSSYLPND